MSAGTFIAWNAITSALATPLVGVNTAATVTPKTMLQIKAGSAKFRIIEWGYSFPTVPVAPVQMELIETGTVFATVTLGEILRYGDVTGPASQTATPGTASTGFSASAEGTITASRLLAQEFDLGPYFKQQFPLGREPEINAGSAARIRATPGSAAAVPVVCYAIIEE